MTTTPQTKAADSQNVRTITINAELTDTFGGEANYSWVRRRTLTLPEGASDLAIVRAAKRELGLSGVPCRREDWGDCIALYPHGSCTVAFISVDYTAKEGRP